MKKERFTRSRVADDDIEETAGLTDGHEPEIEPGESGADGTAGTENESGSRVRYDPVRVYLV